MIAGLQPYPEYKESDQAWLGRVPAHWESTASQVPFREVDETLRPGRGTAFGVALTGVTRARQKTVTKSSPPSRTPATRLVRAQRFRHQHDVGVEGCVGCRSTLRDRQPGLWCLSSSSRMWPIPRCYAPPPAHPHYAGNIYRRFDWRKRSQAAALPGEFLRIPVAVPPPEEQAAMVRFLDYVNGRIERYLRAKKQQLTLVSEMLQNVTQHAMQLPGAKTLRLSAAAKVMSRQVNRRAGHITHVSVSTIAVVGYFTNRPPTVPNSAIQTLPGLKMATS